MRNYLSKITLCILFAGIFLSVNSQAVQSANSGSEKDTKEAQLNRVNTITNKIAGEVKLTDAQKAKLQATLQEVFSKHSASIEEAKKGDESKLAKANADLHADIEAKIKTVLTTDQYNTVMAKEKSSGK